MVPTPPDRDIPPGIVQILKVQTLESSQLCLHHFFRVSEPKNLDRGLLLHPCDHLAFNTLHQFLNGGESGHCMLELRLEFPAHDQHGVGRLVNNQTPPLLHSSLPPLLGTHQQKGAKLHRKRCDGVTLLICLGCIAVHCNAMVSGKTVAVHEEIEASKEQELTTDQKQKR